MSHPRFPYSTISKARTHNSDTELNRVLALSFWHTREDAQRYEREQFDTVQKTVQHLLETATVVRTFDVHTSAAHKVAAEKAA